MAPTALPISPLTLARFLAPRVSSPAAASAASKKKSPKAPASRTSRKSKATVEDEDDEDEAGGDDPVAPPPATAEEEDDDDYQMEEPELGNLPAAAGGEEAELSGPKTLIECFDVHRSRTPLPAPHAAHLSLLSLSLSLSLAQTLSLPADMNTLSISLDTFIEMYNTDASNAIVELCNFYVFAAGLQARTRLAASPPSTPFHSR